MTRQVAASDVWEDYSLNETNHVPPPSPLSCKPEAEYDLVPGNLVKLWPRSRIWLNYDQENLNFGIWLPNRRILDILFDCVMFPLCQPCFARCGNENMVINLKLSAKNVNHKGPCKKLKVFLSCASFQLPSSHCAWHTGMNATTWSTCVYVCWRGLHFLDS